MNNLNVAHEWTSQNKQSAKGSNFYFEGKTIYSYGAHFPIATWYDKNTVFFTTNSYSVTTSKHITYTRRAIPADKQIFYVPKVKHYDRTEKNKLVYDHSANVLYMVTEINQLKKQLMTAQRRSAYILSMIEGQTNHLERYYLRFKRQEGMRLKPKERRKILDILKGKLLTPEERQKVQDKIVRHAERQRLRNEEYSRKEETARAEMMKKATSRLERWKQGDDSLTTTTYFQSLPCALRITTKENGIDQIVETSHGAEVPLLHAVKLLGAWQAGTVEKGNRIGLYTVESITPDEITIGCHKISRTEAERVLSPIMHQ